MGSLFFSLFMIISASGFLFRAESKTFWGDAEVLKKLKQSMDPASVTPGSCVSSWDFSIDPCDNVSGEKFTCGFRCDVVVSGLSRVTELSLDQAGYAASLFSFTWNLPYLETLDVSNNYFSGHIPDSFSNLTRLRRLGLSANSFSGEIPSSIGSLSSLEELYLDNNHLEGAIPRSFNGLVSLKTLQLQSNKLVGQFPDLSSLRNLNYLDLSANSLAGALPASLPVSLIQITIRNNQLTGVLASESFKDLAYLQVVDLSGNRFTGSVPSVLFQLPSLQQLTLSFNQFSSIETPYPGSSLQSGLIAVDLSNNQLQGLLPSFMALMPRLSSLSLENNRFTGLIPTLYAVKTVFPQTGFASFQRLLLRGNYLLGGIPRLLLTLKPDSANLSLVDNCLFRCPHVFFFCQGGQQKSSAECSGFSQLTH
ncbi:LRR receptor-like serine/threonine-protein kinase RGI5 [Lotus japonicus]|uniref:LRR receptor-like serine/threonine-protein kinase RGI5 n=1 Tax=Lotus japonicus TaxID=34305 RepID=UPI00258CC3FF|nr:LRR receptor-like serine/threonine-protein kinase RGI5 [Lotus japonicus]